MFRLPWAAGGLCNCERNSGGIVFWRDNLPLPGSPPFYPACPLVDLPRAKHWKAPMMWTVSIIDAWTAYINARYCWHTCWGRRRSYQSLPLGGLFFPLLPPCLCEGGSWVMLECLRGLELTFWGSCDTVRDASRPSSSWCFETPRGPEPMSSRCWPLEERH